MYSHIDLIGFRRAVLPFFEKHEKSIFGMDIMFSKEVQDVSYTGVVKNTTVNDVAETLKSHPRCYPVNTACLKYWVHEDGSRSYEQGSYAFRPKGFLGKYQTHLRLWDHEDGVAVWIHHELNPWHSPLKHYNGKDWKPRMGEKYIEADLLDIDESVPMDRIIKQN